MEANAYPGNGHAARIDELTRRANACDVRAERQWEQLGRNSTAIAVVDKRVDGVEEDVAEIRTVVSEMRDEFRASRRWLIGAALSFAGLALTAAGLIVAISVGG